MRKLRFTHAGAVAAVTLAAGMAVPAVAQESAQSVGSSSDIIVTATKRAENVRNIPIPISAVTGEQLAKSNANSLSDYIARLPGVVFNDYQPGVSEVVIRGVAATTYHEQGQTTVGYYLNEFVLVEPGFPIGIPDIDTFDLDRVEVLRGPQGTLFGASTLSGLVNYVAKTADPSKIDAAASGLIGSTKNANGDLNYAAKAMVNVPIIQDKLAVRVMALQRYDAGYLDNPGIGKKGTNDFRTRGLRGSVVFTPAEGTKITYMSTYQDSKLDDQTYLDLDHPYVRFTAYPEPQKTSFWLNSLRLDQDLGFGTFSVLGSVNKKTNYTFFVNPYPYVTGLTTGDDTAGGPGHAHANIKTIEARLASKADGPLKWLIGVSYVRAKKHSYDQIFQPGAAAFIDANPGTFDGIPGSVLAPGDRIYGYLTDSLNEDFGVFGEVSYKITDQIELTAGGRYYDTKAKATVVNQAGALGTFPGQFHADDLSGSVNQKEDGFTPKVTLTIRPTSQFMFYATYSKGFRVGGINPNAGLLSSIPTNYESDTTKNYEVGVKASAFDNRLLFDIAAYHIDWNNIQARLFGPGPSYYSYVINAGGADVDGIELSATAKLARTLTFNTNFTYQDAELTTFLPDTFAVGGGYPSGTRLPGSSKISVANNLTLDLPDSWGAPTFEIAHRYLSKAPVAFGNDAKRGGFNVFDLRASVTVANHFRVMGFVNNLFDKFGILNAPFTSQVTPAGSIIRPRSYGLRVDWKL